MKKFQQNCIKSIFLALCLGFSLLPQLSYAYTSDQQFEEALQAADKGDYQTAFNLWLPFAEQGNRGSQFNVGLMYYEGQGVKQDYQQAAKWYQKAAEQGEAKAQTNLGIMYVIGQGVQQNRAIAKMWFGKACDNGDQNGCAAYRQINNEEK